MKNQFIAFKADADMRDRLRAVAKKNGVSVSEIARRAVAAFLEGGEATQTVVGMLYGSRRKPIGPTEFKTKGGAR